MKSYTGNSIPLPKCPHCEKGEYSKCGHTSSHTVTVTRRLVTRKKIPLIDLQHVNSQNVASLVNELIDAHNTEGEETGTPFRVTDKLIDQAESIPVTCECDNLENGSVIIQDKEGKCVTCGSQFPVYVPQETKPSWEERFYKKFAYLNLGKEGKSRLQMDIEDFIRSERNAVLEEVAKLIWDRRTADSGDRIFAEFSKKDLDNLFSLKK